MSEILGNIALWWLCAISWIFLITFSVKSHWWKYAPGRITLMMCGGFTLTTSYIVGRRLGWIPEAAAEWFSFVVFGTFAVAITYNFVFLLQRNWNFWAWSREEMKDGSR